MAAEPERQGALGLGVAVAVLIAVCVAIGQKRWCVAGLDLDGSDPPRD